MCQSGILTITVILVSALTAGAQSGTGRCGSGANVPAECQAPAVTGGDAQQPQATPGSFSADPTPNRDVESRSRMVAPARRAPNDPVAGDGPYPQRKP